MMAQTNAERFAYIDDYKRKHYKRISCLVRKDYYEEVLEPYLTNHITSTSSFIKKCMDYVIKNNINVFKENG